MDLYFQQAFNIFRQYSLTYLVVVIKAFEEKEENKVKPKKNT